MSDTASHSSCGDGGVRGRACRAWHLTSLYTRRAVASAIQRAVGDSQGPGVWQEASQLSPALLPRHIGKVDRAAHKAAAMLLQSRAGEREAFAESCHHPCLPCVTCMVWSMAWLDAPRGLASPADPSGPLQRLMSLYFPSTASADPDTGSLQAAPTPRGRGGRGSRGSTPRQGRRADDRERAWDAVRAAGQTCQWVSMMIPTMGVLRIAYLHKCRVRPCCAQQVAADEAPSTSHSDGGQPLPSISAIQRLPVLQHLMALLFNPARQLPLQDQQRARRILALACSAGKGSRDYWIQTVDIVLCSYMSSLINNASLPVPPGG